MCLRTEIPGGVSVSGTWFGSLCMILGIKSITVPIRVMMPTAHKRIHVFVVYTEKEMEHIWIIQLRFSLTLGESEDSLSIRYMPLDRYKSFGHVTIIHMQCVMIFLHLIGPSKEVNMPPVCNNYAGDVGMACV